MCNADMRMAMSRRWAFLAEASVRLSLHELAVSLAVCTSSFARRLLEAKLTILKLV